MKQDHYRILIGQSGAFSKLISYRLAPTDGSLYISLVRTSKPRSHWTFDIDKTNKKRGRESFSDPGLSLSLPVRSKRQKLGFPGVG